MQLRRTAVERQRVAVVALLTAFFVAVPAIGLHAAVARRRAHEARLEPAGRVTAVTRTSVAVVTALGRDEQAVPAHGPALGVGDQALEALFEHAGVGAAVARRGVAVVARLREHHEAVAADDE